VPIEPSALHTRPVRYPDEIEDRCDSPSVYSQDEMRECDDAASSVLSSWNGNVAGLIEEVGSPYATAIPEATKSLECVSSDWMVGPAACLNRSRSEGDLPQSAAEMTHANIVADDDNVVDEDEDDDKDEIIAPRNHGLWGNRSAGQSVIDVSQVGGDEALNTQKANRYGAAVVIATSSILQISKADMNRLVDTYYHATGAVTHEQAHEDVLGALNGVRDNVTSHAAGTGVDIFAIDEDAVDHEQSEDGVGQREQAMWNHCWNLAPLPPLPEFDEDESEEPTNSEESSAIRQAAPTVAEGMYAFSADRNTIALYGPSPAHGVKTHAEHLEEMAAANMHYGIRLVVDHNEMEVYPFRNGLYGDKVPSSWSTEGNLTHIDLPRELLFSLMRQLPRSR
jgi:hypothetical protein